MAEVVKFTSTRLNGTGKKGVIQPDADGYYEMVVGGLNTHNSAGEYYTLDGAQALFAQSSAFMRRVQNGCLKGEVGHPKRLPGMSMDDYISRILSIEETNICCHFKEIWLDPSYGRNHPEMRNPNLVAIMAKIKPAGVKGEALRQAFENGCENVCFSIRAMTKDYFNRGQCYRVLTQIITWDWVNEPGIRSANKFDSPAMESLDEQFIMPSHVKAVADNIRRDSLAIESNRLIATEALEAIQRPIMTVAPSLLAKW